MRDSHRGNISQSLYLMDDSINIWEVFPVFYPDAPASHHLAELLLDLV